MKADSISELKKTLKQLDHDDLLAVCLRLAKYKVDNKELLTYLLKKSADEQAYVAEVCDEISRELPSERTLHKKTMRKIVRLMDKWIRYSGNKETEIEVRIHFCQLFVDRRIEFGRCRVKANMYATQLKKIDKAIETVHPDLQFDFRHQMDGIQEYLK
ncbi:hypothetical protein LF1_46030 [Rubripirellula obstinata]|uniref:Uncharacterized protein n=1 Tax=Rubripirellula obstinata TaxID=406547 RepID=A0A5B1CNU3_9BACT|nr:hypothetical protein [Rubripirellula obstinata]KAA1262042.1 hypothetical protein LF1_46030 [Rubripirellula obstinata]